MMTHKELCLSLVDAKSEEEVSNIIATNEILKDERNWTAYGNLESNVGTFLNQQSHPVAALSEKIVNSIDALLLLECRKRGIDPKSARAPRSMQEAVEKFFEIKEGDFSEVAEKRRRSIAENIVIIAEGDKKRPNIIIADKGEGQNPKDFEDTFLSLNKRNKMDIPFVQGKFNMGSTGALPFCGEKHYQLILSRRHSDLLTGSQKDFWGFTLVRYREARGFEKSGIFEFCTDNTGDILKFEGCLLSILPGKKNLEYGTFIKMYEYRLERPSLIHRELWKDLNRALFSPAIPVLMHEARDYNMKTEDRLLLGNRMRLKVDDRELVEEAMSIDAVLGAFGMCRIEVMILSDSLSEDKKIKKDEFATQNDAIFFTINGQTHTTLGRSFLKAERKANLDYLADSMIIQIDLSNIPSGVRDHAFMGSRDRMRDDEIKKKVEEDLAEALRKHEGLRRLNQVRREKAITSNPKDEEFLKKLLQKLVSSNVSIAEILGIGVDIKHSEPGPTKIPEFIGKRFPTYLNVNKFNSTMGQVFCKTIPANSYAILKLETDAENGYLDRDKERGELIISPSFVRQSSHLYDGIITLRLIPKKDWKIGEKYRVKIELTRCYDDDPLAVDFDILVGQEETPKNRPSGHSAPPKGKSLKLPKPTLVYKTEAALDGVRSWDQMTPVWTGKDIADIKVTSSPENPDEKQYDVFINMDSDDLHAFLRRKKLSQNEQDFVKRLYQTSILLYSLILYNDLSKINGGKEEMLPEIIKAISKVCLDLAYSESLVKAIEE